MSRKIPEDVCVGIVIHGAQNCPGVAASTGRIREICTLSEFRARDPGALDRTAGVPEVNLAANVSGKHVFRYDRPRAQVVRILP